MSETAESIVRGMQGGEPTGTDPVSLDHEFDLDFEAPNGQRYRGHFKNRILSMADWVTVSAAKSKMLGGAALDSVDGGALALCEMLAHLAVSLVERPGWFDSDKLHEPMVVEAVYEEVMAHQARFRGLDAGPDGDGEAD